MAAPGSPPSKTEFHVYKRRWFILCVICGLNIVNAMISVAFAAVANHVDEFYCIKKGCEAANWFALTSLYSTITVSVLVALWAIEKIGLRIAVTGGTWITFCGTFLRLLSCLTYFDRHWRLPLGLTGQFISSFSQPIVRYLPSILAATWFGSNQRTLATMLASFSGTFASLITTLTVPHLITQKRNQVGIFDFHYALACSALLLVVLSNFGVRSARPPKPPSKSAANRIHIPFFKSLKMLFTNVRFLILAICQGCLIGSAGTFLTLSQQILCSRGYTNVFVGAVEAVSIGGGFIGSVSLAIFVDRTKLYEETIKICQGITSISACAMAVMSNYPGLNVPLIITAFIFGLTGYPTLSIGLELAVECTYPVKSGLVAGLVYLSAQLWIVLEINVLREIAHTHKLNAVDERIQKCATVKSSIVVPYNWSVSMLVWAGLVVGATCVFIIFFRAKYKRMEAENKSDEDTPIEIDNNQDENTVQIEIDSNQYM